MAGKAYTEPIQIIGTSKVADGFGGFTKGTETVKYDTIAIIKEFSNSKFTGDSSQAFSNGYDIEIWKNPSVEVKVEDLIRWRSKNLRIGMIKESDNHLKYIIKATK